MSGDRDAATRREKAPRVSIIMPVFNAGKYLRRSLASAASQTYRDFEIVVVDDGSTDDTTAAILAEAANRRATNVYRTANRGPSLARNTAIERARGEYILPLDADDYLAPTFLEKTVPILERSAATGIVYSWVGLVGSHHGVWRTGGLTLIELLSRCTIHVCALYRREVWVDVGGYDPAFVESCEDWDFWLGAVKGGWAGCCVPEVLAYYRRTASSRELRSRDPEISDRLMRTLVTKHRDVYDANLEDAFAGMYRRLAAAGIALERIYHNPLVRVAVRLRGLLPWARGMR